jgi:hypothetical protein
VRVASERVLSASELFRSGRRVLYKRFSPISRFQHLMASPFN